MIYQPAFCPKFRERISKLICVMLIYNSFKIRLFYPLNLNFGSNFILHIQHSTLDFYPCRLKQDLNFDRNSTIQLSLHKYLYIILLNLLRKTSSIHDINVKHACRYSISLCPQNRNINHVLYITFHLCESHSIPIYCMQQLSEFISHLSHVRRASASSLTPPTLQVFLHGGYLDVHARSGRTVQNNVVLVVKTSAKGKLK